MTPATILLKNGLLTTFTKEDAVLARPTAKRADVLIEGHIIKEVAPANSIAALGGDGVEEALVIDCTDKWIAPGFVDTHRHVWLSIVDDQEDWTIVEYLAKLSWTTTGLVSAEEVYIGELAGALQALHGGTTTILDHFHAANTPQHVHNIIQAADESGIRAQVCVSRQSPNTNVLPLEFGNDAEVAKWQVVLIEELASKANGILTTDGRLTLGLAYDVQGYDPEADKRIISMVRSKNVKPITAHYAGGPAGSAQDGVIKRWHNAGLLGPDVVMSHCTGVLHKGMDAAELELLRDAGGAVAIAPEGELAYGIGNPVTGECLRRGVKAGIGIDSAAGVSHEMFPAMHFALQTERGYNHRDSAMGDSPKAIKHNTYSSATAFRLATLGGAECAGIADKVGSIEPGKLADVVLYDAGSINLANVPDPFKGIAIHATAQDVDWVIVNGKVVKKEGKLLPVQVQPVGQGGVKGEKQAWGWKEVASLLRERQAELRAKVAQYDMEDRYAKVVQALGVKLQE